MVSHRDGNNKSQAIHIFSHCWLLKLAPFTKGTNQSDDYIVSCQYVYSEVEGVKNVNHLVFVVAISIGHPVQ